MSGVRKVTKTQVKQVAEGLLHDFRKLPGFGRAKVSGMWPIYDKSGRRVAYYEVKFSSPEQKDNGYAIISATRRDYPVVEFSEKGLAHHERFRHLTRAKEFRMIRFGPQYITAEDAKGKLVAEIGVRPLIVPKEFRKRKRVEGKDQTALEMLPKKLAVEKKRAIRKAQPTNYKAFKNKFRKPRLSRTELSKRAEAWTIALKPRHNPDCDYEYFWADGFSNHPYYLQIAANTPPNNTSHASGCGPTAWMNLYGWHDRNWTTEILAGNHEYNDAYIDALTMALHDYVGTSWAFGQGFTWPDEMEGGIGFARIHLEHDCSYWYRHDWWNTDETWVFRVARDVARAKRPFVVGYYDDWHYAIGYGIAECKTHGWKKHSWIKIYPAWNYDDRDDKWIPKGTIFGVYGIYNFYSTPTPPTYYIANIREYSRELHLSSCIWVTKMKPGNRKVYHSLQEGLDNGFDGCYYCLRAHHTC